MFILVRRAFGKLELPVSKFIIILILNLLLAISSTIQPIIFGFILDSLSTKNLEKIVISSALNIGVLTTSMLVTYLQQYYANAIKTKYSQKIKKRLISSLENLVYFDEFKSKFYNVMVNDIPSIINYISNNIIGFLVLVLQTLLISIYLINRSLLIFIIVISVFYFMNRYTNNKSTKIKEVNLVLVNLNDKISRSINNNINKLQSIVGSQTVKKVKEMEFYNTEALKKTERDYFKLYLDSTVVLFGYNMILQIIVIIVIVSKYLNGTISIGEFFALNTYSSMLLTQLQKITKFRLESTQFELSFARTESILDKLENFINIDNYSNFEDLTDNILMIRINEFKYVNLDIPIFRNQNYEIQLNSVNLLIGSNGTGKTTLLKIIANMERINSGDIKYNKKSIYPHSMIYIDREFCFIEGSIIKVLSNGGDNANLDKISSVCKYLKLDKVIRALPNEYNTEISLDNMPFSLGEIQRLSIARAIIGGYSLLLFDEITNGLDNENVEVIVNVLLELKEHKTIVVTSHDKRLIEIADNIIDLNNKEEIVKYEII